MEKTLPQSSVKTAAWRWRRVKICYKYAELSIKNLIGSGESAVQSSGRNPNFPSSFHSWDIYEKKRNLSREACVLLRKAARENSSALSEREQRKTNKWLLSGWWLPPENFSTVGRQAPGKAMSGLQNLKKGRERWIGNTDPTLRLGMGVEKPPQGLWAHNRQQWCLGTRWLKTWQSMGQQGFRGECTLGPLSDFWNE